MARCSCDPIINFFKLSMISAPKLTDSLVHRIFFVMQVYLTNVWRLSFTHAAAIMNIWEGMSLIFPAPLQFLADTFLGNFVVAVISVICSIVGIGMVALSVPGRLDHGSCRTREAESCTNAAQEGLFYTGMVLVALGRGGITFSLDAFYDEQSNANASASANAKGCWQRATEKYVECAIWGDVQLFYLIGGVVTFMWISKWKLLFGIPAIYTAYVGFWFLFGCCCWYSYNYPKGKSPLTSICRVLYVAATSKMKSQPLDQRNDNDQKPFCDRFPRCLDRALPSEGEGPVETARFAVRMVPISITFVICGIVSSIGNTYFVEQANHMNRRVGKWNVPLLALQLPILAVKMCGDFWLFVFFNCSNKSVSVDLAINGIRAAMACSVLCCITAAAVETRRLGVIRGHGLLDRPDEAIPMHAAWLLPQFLFLAGVDSCLRISIRGFYRVLVPDHLKGEIEGRAAGRYLDAAVNFVCGLGFLSSALSVYVVGELSGWFRYTLNRSRLDRYYWVLAGLSGANLVAFFIGARCMGLPRRENATRCAPRGVLCWK